MSAISKISIDQISAKRTERAAIVAAQPEFGLPNSHNARLAARRAAKQIEKQIYRARRAARNA